MSIAQSNALDTQRIVEKHIMEKNDYFITEFYVLGSRFFFPKLNTAMKEKCFATIEEIKEKSK